MGIQVSKQEPNLLDSFRSSDEPTSPSSPVIAHNLPCHENQIYLPSELDPRSPSVGIDRTPIRIIPVCDPSSDSVSVDGIEQSKQPFDHVDTVLDPRSPSDGIIRTPIICVGKHTDGTGHENGEVSVQSKHESSLIERVLTFNINDADENEELAAASNEVPNSIEHRADLTAAKKDKSSCDLSETANQLPMDRQTRSLVPRSPLAPYNYSRVHDSPRGIVQRKQVMKVEQLCKISNSPATGQLSSSKTVEKLRGPSSPHSKQIQIYCDKENAVG